MTLYCEMSTRAINKEINTKEDDMQNQPKKQFRFERCYKADNGGFHQIVHLAFDEEHKPFLRAKLETWKAISTKDGSFHQRRNARMKPVAKRGFNVFDCVIDKLTANAECQKTSSEYHLTMLTLASEIVSEFEDVDGWQDDERIIWFPDGLFASRAPIFYSRFLVVSAVCRYMLGHYDVCGFAQGEYSR